MSLIIKFILKVDFKKFFNFYNIDYIYLINIL